MDSPNLQGNHLPKDQLSLRVTLAFVMGNAIDTIGSAPLIVNHLSVAMASDNH